MSENRCLCCMELKKEPGPCPHCGVDDRELPIAANILPAGSVLDGSYLIGRLLGSGGFGNTYLAFDLKLHLKVAIKEFLPKELAGRDRHSTEVLVYTSGDSQAQFAVGLDKFLDEARVLAKFKNHPNIVAVSSFFHQFNTAYIVMDYLEGITFKEYLQRKGGRLPYEEVMKIMTPVLDALREVHEVGMLHRDISPDNVYITRKGQVKVLDFGAARQAMGEASKSLSVILKPGYAPSEQYFTKGKQGPWTDIYAVAATIYHALTGQLPPESLERTEEDTLQPPSALGCELPQHAEAALLKALAIKGSDRFQTVAAFMAALEGAGTHPETPVATSAPPETAAPTPAPALSSSPPVTPPVQPDLQPDLKPDLKQGNPLIRLRTFVHHSAAFWATMIPYQLWYSALLYFFPIVIDGNQSVEIGPYVNTFLVGLGSILLLFGALQMVRRLTNVPVRRILYVFALIGWLIVGGSLSAGLTSWFDFQDAYAAEDLAAFFFLSVPAIFNFFFVTLLLNYVDRYRRNRSYGILLYLIINGVMVLFSVLNFIYLIFLFIAVIVYFVLRVKERKYLN